MSASGMHPSARADVRMVLAGFGITSAQRAVDTDPSEEVLLLSTADFAQVDPEAVALAVMQVLPSTKVWVIEEHPAWEVEPL